MTDTLQILLELKMMGKYTIVYFPSNGYPNRIHFTFKGATMIGMRYDNNMVIIDYRRNHGMPNRLAIHRWTPFVLWEDWVEPDWTIIVNTYLKDTEHGALKMGRSWARFDSRYLQRAKDSIPEPALVWNIPAPKEERLLDFVHVID